MHLVPRGMLGKDLLRRQVLVNLRFVLESQHVGRRHENKSVRERQRTNVFEHLGGKEANAMLVE